MYSLARQPAPASSQKKATHKLQFDILAHVLRMSWYLQVMQLCVPAMNGKGLKQQSVAMSPGWDKSARQDGSSLANTSEMAVIAATRQHRQQIDTDFKLQAITPYCCKGVQGPPQAFSKPVLHCYVICAIKF